MNQTRYAVVAKSLLEGISSGRYPVGSLLPTEFELCELYEVSRHTVRAAITQLQNQGLVSRRKRVGTRVEASSPKGGYSQSLASVSDLVHLAETQVRSIQSVHHFV
ncbi:winged helix-turn-helix domain-containing protein, partial [Pseudomonas neuropathica]|uniref:GntR family transcriptional regulator n=1 Tax=Pseudomonas neuropathica TaxID=2730425 RepID=UPI0034D55A4D